MTRRWLRAPLLAVTLLFALSVAAPALAAPNKLSNGAVSPASGNPATTFTFTVRYEGAAATVTASVAGLTVPMSPVPASANGTFRGTAGLPVGSWQVTFFADATTGKDDDLAGPTVTVTSGATAPPTTAPTPTPGATPPPLPTPIATPQPPPITATPLPPTPLPSLTPSPVGSPGASGFIGGFIRTPPPTSTPDAAPAVEVRGARDEMWTLVMGGLIALSALALLGMVGILRARRHIAVEGPPIGDE